VVCCFDYADALAVVGSVVRIVVVVVAAAAAGALI